ncbi:hypothetical protein FMM05_00505 [Flavobacterium zepuense]|uniref:DoxX-like family protein n=1 Tax=Flavobacterium zepuense TaxID=2593302 RepID=A0A552V9M3_9FLAO|nr:hypothetical protein [Flavobacterium zepuense]TRW27162.1 hypothetical protein FMM05_00505 [Flavobacterium zepuense]
MIKNIISLVLLVTSVGLSFSHGWGSFNYKKNPESLKMMSQLGLAEWTMPVFGVSAILVGILLLLPRTFFIGNLLNALSVVFIMAFALRAGNYRIALIEIPFLAIPLLLIWLKYPFKN